MLFRYLYNIIQCAHQKSTQQKKDCDMSSFIFLSQVFYKCLNCSEIVFVHELVHRLPLTSSAFYRTSGCTLAAMVRQICWLELRDSENDVGVPSSKYSLVVSRKWKGREQVVNRMWTGSEQVVNRKWTGSEQEMNRKWTWSEPEVNMEWIGREQEVAATHSVRGTVFLSHATSDWPMTRRVCITLP